MGENERKIKVSDMIKYIGKHWIVLIICLVVGAVLLGAYGWLKSVDNSVQEDTNWESVLSPTERQRVEMAASFYIKYKAYENEDFSKDDNKYIGKWEELNNQINAAKNIDTYINSFTDTQAQYYAYLIKEDNTQISTNTERTINLKFIVVGAILGFIISAVVLAVIYIVKNSHEKID